MRSVHSAGSTAAGTAMDQEAENYQPPGPPKRHGVAKNPPESGNAFRLAARSLPLPQRRSATMANRARATALPAGYQHIPHTIAAKQRRWEKFPDSCDAAATRGNAPGRRRKRSCSLPEHSADAPPWSYQTRAPRPSFSLRSISKMDEVGGQRRRRCTAVMTPEKPPPTTATS